MTTQDTIEMLDLVSEDDQIIGSIERNEAYANDIRNIRVIDCLIKNDEGKLFIPRRQKHKRLFPLGLDTSVGGHVSSGETYDEAFFKEAREELSLDMSHTPYSRLGTMTPHEDGTKAFITIYEIRSDETPAYNPDDFIDHYWLKPHEVLERLANGDVAKDHLPMILKKFYLS